MRVWLWAVMFLAGNAIGVEVFKAAVTLPVDEALVPRLLSVPLIGLTALSAARIVSAWGSRGR
jgi:hypothetical protein